MTEASRGRVTITLGRSGQVVKRAGDVSGADYSNSGPRAGNKRSVRDRLGSGFDSWVSNGSESINKRQRGDLISSFNDVRISKDDLRLKLMRKNASKQAQGDDHKVVDLREKLLKSAKPSSSSVSVRQGMPAPRDNFTQSRMPPARNVDDFPRMSSSRNSYSPWTLEHIKSRSPDRIAGTSRGLSPPRILDKLHGQPLSRTYDDMRGAPYMSRNVLGPPPPVHSPYTTRSSLPAPSRKPAPPPPVPAPSLLSQLRPPIMQKNPYTIEEHQTVDALLNSLGLGKYAILFKAEEVDMTVLKQMGETDLKDLGIPMGPRKKILLALPSRPRRQS